ncbi:MAG: nickel pincer cofactor biosynthesis protein LarC [Actinomycetota bacterium]
MRILYFDCTAGAAGDMILGALLDAGAPVGEVRSSLDALDVAGWQLDLAAVTRGGLRATHAKVSADDESSARSYSDIIRIVSGASLSDSIKSTALKAFDALATAEARVHARTKDDVHLHEVGGIDALVDIIGSCAALDHFRPAHVVTSPIATGVGTIEGDHGTLPLPAPAVAEILKGAVLTGRAIDRELITPTGAAILVAVTDEFADLPEMRLEATGYGAGSWELDWPNVVRVLVGDGAATVVGDDVFVIETNLDDMSPEFFPHVIETLLIAGAQDVWVTPIVMKKGRPGYTLSALVDASAKERVADGVYRETTTLGLRITPAVKDALTREWIEIDVASCAVRVKLGRRAGEIVTIAPEHDDAVKAAKASGLPLKEVYSRALQAARDHHAIS